MMYPAQAERLLKLITDSLEQGKDFVLEQAPDVVQQLIMLKRIEYSVYAVLAGLLLAAAVTFILWSIPHVKKEYENFACSEWLPVWALSSMLSGGLVLLATISLVDGVLPVLLKVWLAPKVFLLEYLASIIK